MGFPGGSDRKESACDVGDLGSVPGSGRSPGGGNGNPLQCFCLENPGQRSLAGYSPRGHKESDTTEQLSPPLPIRRSLAMWYESTYSSLSQSSPVASFFLYF